MNPVFEIIFDENQWVNTPNSVYHTDSNPVIENKEGVFFCINALEPTKTRANGNVCCLRNFLFEFDKWIHRDLTPLSKREQFSRLMEVRNYIPWASLVWSGNKSMHGIISLNDPCTSIDEYQNIWYYFCERIEKLLGTSVDKATKNPSRLTRFPDAVRDNGEVQELMFLGSRIDKPKVTNTKKKRKPVIYVGISEESKGKILHTFHNAQPGSRNGICFWAAGKFKEAGVKVEDAIGMLQQYGSLSTTEVERTVRSAYEREENKRA